MMNMDEIKALNALGRIKNWAQMKKDATTLTPHELRWNTLTENLQAAIVLLEGMHPEGPMNLDRDFMGVLPPLEAKP